MNEIIAVGDQFEVVIEKLLYGGEGLARKEDLVIFIPLSAPGDQLLIRITSLEKRHARGEILKILKPGDTRRTAPCPHFGNCGGCQLQHLSYEGQLAVKAEFIRDALSRIGQIDWPHPIKVEHRSEFGYRTRAQLKLDRTTRPIQLGFYQAGSHQVCDIEACPILIPELNQALTTLRTAQKEILNSAIPYTKIEVTGGENGIATNQPVGHFATNAVKQSVAGIEYSYDPGCFFQVNNQLLETLVNLVVADRRGMIAIDLYAGVGLFALQLAGHFQKVLATEVYAPATKWAQANIKANRLKNIDFAALSTEKWLAKFSSKYQNVDLIVLDPPRAGVTKNAIANVISMKPNEIVYVSCDPSTLARDLKILQAGKYQITSVTGVDLFPQTYHIETVVSLKKHL